MSMGLEPMWTSLSDMLATRTDYQLLRWKEVAENPRIDNYRSITTLRQLVVDLYNKSIKDIINELSMAVDNELNSRNGNINIDEKLEQRVARLEKLIKIKNEADDYFDDEDELFDASPEELAKIDELEEAASTALNKAIAAVNEALSVAERCAVELDEMDCVGLYRWDKVIHDLEAANSYMPKDLKDYRF